MEASIWQRIRRLYHNRRRFGTVVVRGLAWIATLVVLFFLVVPHLGVIGGKNTTLRAATGTPTFSASSGAVPIATTAAGAPGDTSNAVTRVVQRTNMYRAQFGCPALKLNAQLTQSAQGHSDDMAQHNLPGHIGSNGSTPAARITATGYKYANWAENVAWGQPTPEAAVDAWFFEKPPNDGHRRNILNCTLLDIGVGFAQTTQYAHFYWTQDFGRAMGT
jgi:uncharacterized protein YkwD